MVAPLEESRTYPIDSKIAITFDQLLSQTQTYLPENKIPIIRAAYDYAAAAHAGQERKSKEPYIVHPLEVTMTLAEWHMDAIALVAGLLHDVVEDNAAISIDDIRFRFGDEVAKLVDGVTKITQAEARLEDNDNGRGFLEESDDRLAKYATIRKLFVATADDVRVAIIKLADRKHNMKTLGFLKPKKRIAIAQETREVYIPLANFLGMWDVKWDLEDLALKHLESEAYNDISSILDATRLQREERIESVRSTLQAALDNAGISAEVTGRDKNIFSIMKKIDSHRRHNLGVKDIHDLFTLRVVVRENKNKDCYLALRVVHALWRPLNEQFYFHDYIATPKHNQYKSLHTTVRCMDGNAVEVQIRTIQMHRVAEHGVVAHWLFDGNESDAEIAETMEAWSEQIRNWQRAADAKEFVESITTDVLQDQISVSTPKGEIRVPDGASVLDLACHTHPDVWRHCVGANVNGRYQHITYRLRHDDFVEILTDKAAEPRPEWLNPNLGYFGTKHGDTQARLWFRQKGNQANIADGDYIFRTQFSRLNPYVFAQDIATTLKFASKDEFLAALGRGGITVQEIVDRINDRRNYPGDTLYDLFYEMITRIANTPERKFKVLGLGDLTPVMAEVCCNPIYGDEIVACPNRDDSPVIHRANCDKLASDADEEHLIPVCWDKWWIEHTVALRVEARDRVGLYDDITSIFGKEGVNIKTVEDEETIAGTLIIYLTVCVDGMAQLHRICCGIERLNSIISVTRE